MSSLPSDVVAVVDKSQARFWVYYVNTEGYIKVLKGPEDMKPEDSESDKEYESNFKVTWEKDGSRVKANADSPKLAVVDYIAKGGKSQVQLTATRSSCRKADPLLFADSRLLPQ